MSGPTVVSLFAGIGLVDHAAERAGMRSALLCEKDAACRAVLAEHFPDAVIHPDVTELTADDLAAAGAVPERTVLTAGWPCQGGDAVGSGPCSTRYMGEDENGNLLVPSKTRADWWDRRLNMRNPTHWPYYFRSRRDRNIAMIELASS